MPVHAMRSRCNVSPRHPGAPTAPEHHRHWGRELVVIRITSSPARVLMVQAEIFGAPDPVAGHLGAADTVLRTRPSTDLTSQGPRLHLRRRTGIGWATKHFVAIPVKNRSRSHRRAQPGHPQPEAGGHGRCHEQPPGVGPFGNPFHNWKIARTAGWLPVVPQRLRFCSDAASHRVFRVGQE